MERGLRRLRVTSQSRYVRFTVSVVLLFLTLAGLVALIGELGLGSEISKYRAWVWIGLIVASVIGVSVCELVRSLRQLGQCMAELADVKVQLGDAEARLQSALQLMTTYRQMAYADLLQHLDRLMSLIANRQRWQATDARVVRVRIKPSSDAQTVDPEFAMGERLEVIINIGALQEVARGMEFLVQDSMVPFTHGTIAVQSVFEGGAICSLIDAGDGSFWTQAIEQCRQPGASLIQMPDNRISPDIPPALMHVSSQLAEELKAVVGRIAASQQDGERA